MDCSRRSFWPEQVLLQPVLYRIFFPFFLKRLPCFVFPLQQSENKTEDCKTLFFRRLGESSRVLGRICQQRVSGQLLFTVMFLMALRSTLWKNDEERKKTLCVCVSMGIGMGGEWSKTTEWGGMDVLSIQQLSPPSSRPTVCHRLTVPSAYNTHLEFQIFFFFLFLFSPFLFSSTCVCLRTRVLAGMPL